MTPTLAEIRPYVSTQTQAIVLQKLIAFYRSSRLTRDGVVWTAPKLATIADQIGVHKATVCRAVRWLAEQGFILIDKARWARSPRLYFRVLVKAVQRDVQLERNLFRLQDATCNYRPTTFEDEDKTTPSGEDAPEISGGDEAGGDVPLRKRRSLSGALKDTPPPEDRPPLQENAGGHAVASHWNRLLQEEGHPRFDVTTPALTHIKRLRARFAKDGEDLQDHLETLVGDWLKFAPKKAGKTPHPWAALRAYSAYQAHRAAWAAYHAHGPEVTPAQPIAPSAPAQASLTPTIVVKEPVQLSIMEKFKLALAQKGKKA